MHTGLVFHVERQVRQVIAVSVTSLTGQGERSCERASIRACLHIFGLVTGAGVSSITIRILARNNRGCTTGRGQSHYSQKAKNVAHTALECMDTGTWWRRCSPRARRAFVAPCVLRSLAFTRATIWKALFRAPAFETPPS